MYSLTTWTPGRHTSALLWEHNKQVHYQVLKFGLCSDQAVLAFKKMLSIISVIYWCHLLHMPKKQIEPEKNIAMIGQQSQKWHKNIPFVINNPNCIILMSISFIYFVPWEIVVFDARGMSATRAEMSNMSCRGWRELDHELRLFIFVGKLDLEIKQSLHSRQLGESLKHAVCSKQITSKPIGVFSLC